MTTVSILNMSILEKSIIDYKEQKKKKIIIDKERQGGH
jgi:hypothetical protein